MGYARKRVTEELLAKANKVLNHPESSDEWYRWPWAKKDVRLTKEYQDFIKYKAYLEEQTAAWLADGHVLDEHPPCQALRVRFIEKVLLPLEKKAAAIKFYNEINKDILIDPDKEREKSGSKVVEQTLLAV